MSNMDEVDELKLFAPRLLFVKKYLHEVMWKMNVYYKTLSLRFIVLV